MSGRTAVVFGVASVVVVALLGCAPARTGVAGGSATPETSVSGTPTADGSAAPISFVSIVDGDTIETSEGTVRIIGIDAPESGQCGHDEASATLASVLAPGNPVTLELPAGQNDRDQHQRLIRYVTTATGTDLGQLQLQAGNAVARYDSTDGYPAHPREAEYRAAQTASIGADGVIVTAACQAAAAPPPVAKWWEQYSSCTKLKDITVGDPTGPFSRDDPAQAEIYDWFANRTGNNGDSEGDGLACE